MKKHRTRRQCEILIPRFLPAIHQLRHAGLAQLAQLGQALASWSQEKTGREVVGAQRFELWTSWSRTMGHDTSIIYRRLPILRSVTQCR